MQAVVLDLDGTLLDTERLYRRAFMAALSELGFAFAGDFYGRMIGLPSTERGQFLRKHFGDGFPWQDWLARYCAIRAELLRQGVQPKPGAIALLDWLEASSVPVAIATSASRVTAEANLRRAGLRRRRAVLVTRDDTPLCKPAPLPFLRAASALGAVPAHCIAIEDSPIGVRAALAAGVPTIMVPDAVHPSARFARRCLAVLPDLDHARVLLAHAAEPPVTWNVQPAA